MPSAIEQQQGFGACGPNISFLFGGIVAEQKRNNKAIMEMQIVVGALLFGCLLSVWRPFVQGRKLAQASVDWPKVRGQIIDWVPPEQTAMGTPKIEYAYSVGSEMYHANAIAFGLPEDRQAFRAATKYQEGEAVWVYYDPANPARAVLHPGGSALRRLLADPPVLLNLIFSGTLSVVFVVLLIRAA